MVEEFTRLALELSVLNPERLREIGDEMMDCPSKIAAVRR